MVAKPIDEMTEEEFESFLDGMEEAPWEEVTAESLGEALWAIQARKAPRHVELLAEIVEDRLRFEASPAVSVQGNEIIMGDTRLVITLKAPRAAATVA